MDNLALQAMVRELEPAISGQTIQRVKLCDEAPATLCLNLRTGEELVVALFPSLPLCFLSRKGLALDSRKSEQSALLRKHLTGARFIGIKKEIVWCFLSWKTNGQ
jgi:predicted ribosome quality control (RQC) complex YloA/Tae2 family protein